MDQMSRQRKIAYDLLEKVALSWMFDKSGIPTKEAWERLPSLSRSERVIVALAFAIADYFAASERVLVSDFMRLDNYQLRAVSAALAELAR